MFLAIGIEAFARRVHKEHLATGEKLRKRTVETRDDLTAQESQVARLAREGLSNPDIGARLLLSPRTVEWHLRKVLGKGRAQLLTRGATATLAAQPLAVQQMRTR